MDALFALYVLLVLAALALAMIAVWAPREPRMKIAALAIATALMALGHGALVELLGRPKPASMEWIDSAVPEATVLAASLREGEAIYLWLALDGGVAPRAYVLPWSSAAARQLQQAQRQAEANGTAVRMRRPFEASLDDQELMFYAPPQPPLPPKMHVTG